MSKRVSILYTKQALKALAQLDKTIAARIIKKIENNALQSDSLSRAKPLTGVLAGKYRYRIGDYRAIFIIDEKGAITILTVLTIKQRKDIYR